jgi:hypothetical protein
MKSSKKSSKKSSDSMYGWHIINGDKKLTHGDYRVVKAGEALTVVGDVELCWSGLHACKKVIDVLNYDFCCGNDNYLCRVKLSGELEHDNKKSAGKRRFCCDMISVKDKVFTEFVDSLVREAAAHYKAHNNLSEFNKRVNAMANKKKLITHDFIDKTLTTYSDSEEVFFPGMMYDFLERVHLFYNEECRTFGSISAAVDSFLSYMAAPVSSKEYEGVMSALNKKLSSMVLARMKELRAKKK